VKRRWWVVCAAAVVLVVVTVVVVIASGASSAPAQAEVKPLLVVPGPAGTVGGTAPDSSGRVWALVNLKGVANAQLISLSTGHVDAAVALPTSARALARGPGGVIALGLSAQNRGALEFYSATGATKMGVVALSGPVSDVVSGVDGKTFYALEDIHGAKSVSVVNDQSLRVQGTIPLPSTAVSIAVSANGTTVYALEPQGHIDLINVASGAVEQSFIIGSGGRQLVMSADGGTLYVLHGTHAVDNVAVIDVATESTVSVLPAPASCQWIALSADGTQLADFVGSSTAGNIELYSTNR
jgi:DNA-binding beta-propeller fold protein YncE